LTLVPYPGRIPSNVSKEAKYSVRSAPGGAYAVRLVYAVGSGERELLTTDSHDVLVDMVNAVKVEAQGARGGVFYINEYKDVLVPTQSGCFYAGNYEPLLAFDFEGTVISPRAPVGLVPGADWRGPHAGTSYVLTASGDDVRYEHTPTPTRVIKTLLSDAVGASAARTLAQRLGRTKGPSGGRIYINEACEFFAPLMVSGNLEYRYLGPLDDDAWFPAPDVDRGSAS